MTVLSCWQSPTNICLLQPKEGASKVILWLWGTLFWYAIYCMAITDLQIVCMQYGDFFLCVWCLILWSNGSVARLQFFVPFTVFVHTVVGWNFCKQCIVLTVLNQKVSFFAVHSHKIQIRYAKFGQFGFAFWAEHFVPVQHMYSLATFTIVKVHHNKTSF